MYDFAVVGGGIVGLSAALGLSERFPRASIVVLEKESSWGLHQTRHNSGVIHSGIYYRPGSLKARLAVRGNADTVEFCREHDIPCEVRGKVIVAHAPSEIPILNRLYERGRANGIEVRRVAPPDLRLHEPHAKSGLGALQVPGTGVVDFGVVAERMAALLGDRDVALHTGFEVRRFRSGDRAGVVLESERDRVRARYAVACAGLHSDRLARAAGVGLDVRIVPFRGEYFEVLPPSRDLVQSLIYPVPDPRFPFLGVHLTRGVDGSVHAGPNAVLSWKREGYLKGDFAWRDARESVLFPGLWRLALRTFGAGFRELLRSASKVRFAQAVRELVPEIRARDLRRAGSGVRAQAVHRSGRLVDDFLILEGERSLHVVNAPSPAATAALPIGREIARRVPPEVLPV